MMLYVMGLYPQWRESMGDNVTACLSLDTPLLVFPVVSMVLLFKIVRGKKEYRRVLKSRSMNGAQIEAVANAIAIAQQGDSKAIEEATRNAVTIENLEKELSYANQRADINAKKLEESKKEIIQNDRTIKELNKKIYRLQLQIDEFKAKEIMKVKVGRQKEELMELFTISDEKAERIIDFLIRVQKEDKSLSRDYVKRLMQYYIELCSLGILHDNMSAFSTYFFPSSGKSSEESYRKALTNARIKLQNADDESREIVRRQIRMLVK